MLRQAEVSRWLLARSTKMLPGMDVLARKVGMEPMGQDGGVCGGASKMVGQCGRGWGRG